MKKSVISQCAVFAILTALHVLLDFPIFRFVFTVSPLSRIGEFIGVQLSIKIDKDVKAIGFDFE